MTTRYLIEMDLSTQTWLHVGDGGPPTIMKRSDKSGAEASVELRTVARDWEGRPYLPATGIKGPLRAAFGECFGIAERDRVFGGKDLGGAFDFHDAFSVGKVEVGQRASAAISRDTRTALDQHLSHVEVVRPGATFRVQIIAQRDDEGAVCELLTVLAMLGSGRIAVGAGGTDGWGRLKGGDPVVKKLDSDGQKRWLKGGCVETGVEVLKKYGTPCRGLEAAKGTSSISARKPIPISLSFDGPFLINDPLLEFKKGVVSQRALRDVSNAPYLPASSFRGVLRAQAERILMTLYGPSGACSMAAPCGPLVSIADMDPAERPFFPDGSHEPFCPACRVFGATGWASCLSISDFTSSQAAPTRVQDFVAIDRFTQGSAHKKKFDAERAESPTLKGELGLDHARLKAASAADWGAGLVALALRDLVNGDSAFGFGRAKGYGRASSKVPWQDLEPEDAPTLVAQVERLNALGLRVQRRA